VYVALDEPFVDVLVRFENLGTDQYELSDDDLAVVGKRSGDRIELGQRLLVVIEEASVMRRITLARRVLASGKPDASRSRAGERDKSVRTRGSRTETPKADARKPRAYTEPRSTSNAKGRTSPAAKLPRLKPPAANKGKPLGRGGKTVKKNRSK
jgi:ribonuclease R